MGCLQNNSDYCVQHPNDHQLQCFPEYSSNANIYYGAWVIVIAIIGVIGNGLTLIAIPIASKHKRLTFLYYNLENKQSNGYF